MTTSEKFTFHGDELEIIPPGWPKSIPPTARLLGGASRAFSPVSHRDDTYKGWSSPKANRVFIWWKDPFVAQDLGVPNCFRPYASGPLDEGERTAFRNALAFGWLQDVSNSDNSLPMPEEMTVGLFREVDFLLICQSVWPSKRADDA